MWERHTLGYALALLGGWGGGGFMEFLLLRPTCSWRQLAGKGEANQACHPWVSQVGTPGEGAPTPLSLPPLGWRKEELPASPLPISQLLAAFPKHLVGAY